MAEATTLEELLREQGLSVSSTAPGSRVYSTCPHCSHTRKTKAHRETRVVGVNIASDGKSFSGGCNHCGAIFGGRPGASKKSKSNGSGGQDTGSSIIATYDYVDELSTFLFQVCRKADKQQGFPQRTLKPNGEWTWSVPDTVRRTLYRLPELLSSVAAGVTIFVVEGEKDVNRLYSEGVTATCNPGGASEPGKKTKWRPEYSEILRGADVVIIPDHDDPGYAHAEEVARSIRRVARRVRILRLADHWKDLAAKKGGDASDALEMGHTIAEILELTETCPDWRDPIARTLLAGVERACTLQHEIFPPLKMVIPKYLPEGLSLFAGRPKMGKSFLSLGGLISVARGGEFLGQKCDQGDVLYLALEDSKPRLQRRLTGMLGAQLANWPERLHYTTRWARLDQGGYDALWEWARTVPEPRLIVIDTLTKIRPPRKRDEDPYKSDYDAIAILAELPKTFRMAVMCVLHQRKGGSEYGVDTISGTLGQAAAVDQYVLLEKLDNGVVLTGEGRDVEAYKIAVQLDEKGWWKYAGTAAQARSTERASVIVYLAKHGAPAHFRDIAEALGGNIDSTKVLLGKMARDGELDKTGQGMYGLPQDTMPF